MHANDVPGHSPLPGEWALSASVCPAPGACRSNLEAASWRLPEDDFAALSAFSKQYRQAAAGRPTLLSAALARHDLCWSQAHAEAHVETTCRLFPPLPGTPPHPAPSACRMLDGAWCVSPEGPYRSLEELWDTEHERGTSNVRGKERGS